MKINPIPYRDPEIDLSDITVVVLFYNYREQATLMVPQGYLANVLGDTPSMSVLAVAAVLLKYGCNVKIVDAALHDWDVHRTVQELKKYSPDYVGITITSADFNHISKPWIRVIKKELGCKIVVGGELATFYPREVLETTPEIDYLIRGQSDQNLGPLLARVRDGKPPDQIPGVGFRNEDGDIVLTPEAPGITELESFPFLPYNLLEYEKYTTPATAYKNFTGALSVRSCPYSCNYCIERHPRYVEMSPKRLVDELEWAHVEFNMNEYNFWDPTFNINRHRVAEICDEIGRRGLKIHFSIHARPYLMSEELLKKLKKAGCLRIQYGVECGDETVLASMNRGIKENLDHVREVFKMTQNVGISAAGYLVNGLPYQTHESFIKTAHFMRTLPIDYVISLPAYIGPGTGIYNRWKEENGHDFWAEHIRSGEKDIAVTSNKLPRYWDPAKIWKYNSHILRAVYFRPRQILKVITKDLFSPCSYLYKWRAAKLITKLAFA
ncbi:radical SAM protein [bacterium]|nr:radical SAM protein [bacterium]